MLLLKHKLKALVEDIGLERVLEDNDLTDEEVLEFLYKKGLIDISQYFIDDSEEEEDDG